MVVFYSWDMSHAPIVCGWILFSELVTKVHVSWFPFNLKVLQFHSIANPIKVHIHGFCLYFFIVPLMMLSAVELSVMVSVACCMCPISLSVFLIALSYLALYNNAPHYASAADEITLRMLVEMTIIALFGRLLSSLVPSI